VADKSRVTILVPPSVRVEMTGFGVTQGHEDEKDPGYRLPADAPVIQVRGIAYKARSRSRPARPSVLPCAISETASAALTVRPAHPPGMA
jgi:hypothetical protein